MGGVSIFACCHMRTKYLGKVIQETNRLWATRSEWKWGDGSRAGGGILSSASVALLVKHVNVVLIQKINWRKNQNGMVCGKLLT